MANNQAVVNNTENNNNLDKPKKKKSLTYKICLAIFLPIFILVSLFFLLWSSLHIAKYFVYPRYYEVVKKVTPIAGINDHFIPQGIAKVDDYELGEYILTSGYSSKKGEASMVYLTNRKNNSYDKFTFVNDQNEAITGHFGGIAYDKSNKNVYIADDGQLYVISFDKLDKARTNGETENLKFDDVIKVNNQASFVFCDDAYLYVGEFYYKEKNYLTDPSHSFQVDANYTYNALVSIYKLNDLTSSVEGEEVEYFNPVPVRALAIQDKVQGMAIDNDGYIYLSTSYGLASSYIYTFKIEDSSETNKAGSNIFTVAPEATLKEGENTIDVVFLNEAKFKEKIKTPPMSEELDIDEDRILTLTESASDKYIFGKFFFATNINSLPTYKNNY